MTRMLRFLRDESGATAIEYALIVTLIAMVIIGGATLVGESLDETLTDVGNQF